MAVAENAKGRGKKSSGRKARNVTLLAAVAASGRALQVMALSSLTAAAAMFPTQAFATASGSSLPDAVLLSANGDTQQTDRVTSPLLSSTPASYVAVTGMNDGTDQAPVAAAQGAIAIGSNAVATVGAGGGIDPIAIGRGAQAGSQGWTGAIALGGVSSASNDGIAIGEGASATAAGTAAVGRGAVASASNAMALGKYSTASANNAVALGQGTVARRANTVDVGLRQITSVAAATQNTDAVNLAQLKAMGANVDSSGNVWSNFVAYDDMTMNTLTLKGANGTKITRLAAGTVAAGSTDAVNGSQLYAHAASTAVALGGSSTVNADGTITAPSYSVGGTVVNSVGGAISNLDGRVTQNTNDIANLQTTVGSISGTVANAVQYDSSAHNSVTLGGSSSAPPVKLTNLQAGTLSATSTDAVTGAQLWTTNQQVSDLTQAVQNVQTTGTIGIATNTGGVPAAATGTSSAAIGGGATASAANSVAIGQGSLADQPNTISVGSAGNERRITNVADGLAPTDAVNMRQFESGMSDIARNAYSGTASAIALTMIPDVDANKNLAIGVGTSGYKGYQAVAVGLSARVTQSLKVKLGAGISSATTTVGAGAAYQW